MLTLCIINCFAGTFEVQPKNLYAPSHMQGQVRLVRDANHQFTALVGSEEFHIKSYNVRGLPDDVTNEGLGQTDMYFRLTEDGILQATPRLRGGGFLGETWKLIKKALDFIAKNQEKSERFKKLIK